MKKREIIVYFANWNLEKKPAARGGEVGSIPWDKVTYINHAFWAVAPADGSTETSFERRAKGLPPRKAFHVVSMRPEYDYENQEPSALDATLPRNHFAQYEAYAKRYPHVTIMLSIGGWARCGYFSEMAYTKEGRNRFIQSCILLLQKYPWLGGIDIDWEYPGCTTAGERAADPAADDGDEGCPIWGTPAEDNANFASLLQELREALNRHFGQGQKKLTACAGASTTTTLPCQDWASAAPYLDMINLMTYDLAGVWDGYTGHASSLIGARKAVDYLKAQGIAEEKLCIGSPFYGIAFLMKETDPRQVVKAPAFTYRATDQEIAITECLQFEADAVSGFVTAKEGKRFVPGKAYSRCGTGWHFAYDTEDGASYLYNDAGDSPYERWFITYESHVSLQAKLDFILNSSLAGIIIWECSQDTADYSMLSQMAEQL
ncbi:MAG: hypothetical protein IJ833_05090 [Lachnospiraceae bacterium]|nr:hypothetical protein [Lachnospiraceae bacterium]